MTEEEIFWNWFQSASKDIIEFIESDKSDMAVYEELTKQLRTYNELLTPELTAEKNGTYILVLTCEGNPNGVYHVQKLAHFAPPLPDWKIQQFRQPGNVLEIQLEGLDLKPEDFFFDYWKEGDKHCFDMYIPNYMASDNRFQMLAFLYLDHYLGEFNVITKIAAIGFKKLEVTSDKSKFISLVELQERIISDYN